MIASDHGTVLRIGTSRVVIDVGGIGLSIFATPTTLSGLREGNTVTLFTSLVVREDSLTLFGFADEDERETFDILQGVSGVGPKLALSVLSVHTPDALRAAVASERPRRCSGNRCGAGNAEPKATTSADMLDSSTPNTSSLMSSATEASWGADTWSGSGGACPSTAQT